MKLDIAKLVLLLYLGICGLENGFGQSVGSTSFQFLKIIPDAHSAGMAGASVAFARSADAVFWNPAGLTDVAKFDINFSHVDWFLDTRLIAFAASYSNVNIGTIAIQGLYNDFGSFKVTTVEALGWEGNVYNPGLTGEVIHPNSWMAGITYARKLTNKLSFGFTSKYVNENLIRDKVGTVMFDGGLLLKTGFRSLQLGASIRHFGPDVKYVNESFPLPQTFSLGICGYLFAPKNAFLMQTNHHRLLLAYELMHPRDYDQQHKVGIEYGLLNFLFIRVGYRFNFDEQGLTYGFGIRANNIKMDYAYDPFGSNLDSVHRLTLGFEVE